MTNFIHEVLRDVLSSSRDVSQYTFILPNKRAGTFLKNELSKLVKRTLFTPEILSIEDFIQELSQLNQITNPELLFKFYQIYLKFCPSEIPDSFDTFSKWAQMALQDYNEIDRHLADSNEVFNYLSAVKKIEQWSLDTDTSFIKSHLEFWQQLFIYYKALKQELLDNDLGYQGLIYREAVENLQDFIESNRAQQYVFMGFNALNKAESIIIQELLQDNMAIIYWDIDHHFIDNTFHDAGYFIRQYLSKWPYFKSNSFNWKNNYYTNQKAINCISVPKNVGQAKYIGELLHELSSKNSSLTSTALVLGDETLLPPILSSIPDSIEKLNITMGFPLKLAPLTSLFELLFQLHSKKKTSFYYKDVISILSHQNISALFYSKNKDVAAKIISDIRSNNLIYLSKKHIDEMANDFEDLMNLLFNSWLDDPEVALQRCLDLIVFIKDKDQNLTSIASEYLFKLNTVFNKLYGLNTTYGYIDSIKTLQSVFNDILDTETIDFKGEPLEGLQIMGMLESRVLDFETVIISSVNEGVLPAGKVINSFIPYDAKLEYELPTYKEKDAIYSYHFFRLLQRAKNVYLIYNSQPDVLAGGEKSRFITQLEIERTHNVQHKVVSPTVPNIIITPKRIKKTAAVLQQLEIIAHSGFSPSSLTQYIRNPIDFYYEKILNIKEQEDVEETVAANTLGTVVHNTLEEFYKPLEGQLLTIETLEGLKSKIDVTVVNQFKAIYKKGDLLKGKNLIIFEIAKRYVFNFLKQEIDTVKQGASIKIIAIESDDNYIRLNIPELNFPVYLKGKIDRVDEYDGIMRIIDYKTGHVEPGKLTIVDWEELNTDYDKFSKPYQILTYAYMMNAKASFKQPVKAGIISFKNLSKGFMPFGLKEASNNKNKKTVVDQDILISFETQLKKLIIEICNSELDFIEKEV